MSDVVERRRQDLGYLHTLVSGVDRVYLDGLQERQGEEEVLKAELQRLAMNDPMEVKLPMDLSFLQPRGTIPVSGLMLNGIPIHPPGKYQEKGNVKVNRLFGPGKRDLEWLRRINLFMTEDELQGPLRKFAYCRGSPEGMVTRLKELTTRKVPQITTSLGVSKQQVISRIIRLLPVDLDLLRQMPINWHSDLSEQFQDLETSKISSAGAPYWKPKPQAAVEAMDVVLPLLHEAISEAKIPELFKKQPELFLGEVKNKLDRYEPSKFSTKTRPYLALPFHWQALFSMMSQKFTQALKLFYQDGSNAYGFSWAHGGATKLVEFARDCKNLEEGGRPKFMAYGDDCDIYFRRKGVLYRIAPDFRQMDGSVDHETVKLAVVYITACLSEAWGENPFFERVAEWWVLFATNPLFMVDSDIAYQKKQKDGLMTGVVGTTFFDTVKTVLAYDEWATQVADYKEYKYLEEGHAISWFRDKFGLHVKEGTWKPSVVQEYAIPGALWSDQKFLGTMLKFEQGPNRVEPVPYLDEDDWLSLLLNPRDDPSVKVKSGGGRGKESYLSRSRKWFDRLRGYYITGAFSNDRIRLLLGSLLNMTDPVAVVMGVQANRGTGEAPEANFLEDFQWPDSAGVPSLQWAQNLYFTAENQWEEALWIKLFPSIEDQLTDYRRRNKPLKPQIAVFEVASKHPEAGGHPTKCVQYETLVETGRLDVEKEQQKMDPISGPKMEVKIPEKTPQRSQYLNFEGDERKPAHKLPTLKEVVWEMFSTEAITPSELMKNWKAPGHFIDELSWAYKAGISFLLFHTPVLSVAEICDRIGRDPGSVEKAARASGLYVFGKRHRYITKVPLIYAKKGPAQQQEAQKEQNAERRQVVSEDTTRLMKVKAHSLPAEPMKVEVEELTPAPELDVRKWKSMADPTSSLNHLMQSNFLIPVIESRNVSLGKVQYTQTRLSYKTQNKTVHWLSTVGHKAKDNMARIFEYVRRLYRLDEHSPPEEDWAKEVEKEEKGRFSTAEGYIFAIRGRVLTPDKDIKPGPWVIDKRSVYIGDVLWKQRKSETLAQFVDRTRKALSARGIQVDFEPTKELRLKQAISRRFD